MSDVRKNALAGVQRMVIKLGTQLLSDKSRGLDQAYISSIATQVANLRQRGIRCTLVSSGAIGCGMAELKLTRRPTDLAQLQAVAAIGQRKLVDTWADALGPHGIHAAQLLITRDDIENRARYLNLRNTIAAVHDLGGVPIINENDTVSTDEIIKITFGDNDILAAMVTNALRANVLVLMTVVDGVLDAGGRRIDVVDNPEQAQKLVRAEKTRLGKGGMSSKVEAARMVTGAGDVLVIVNGRMENVLEKLVDGQEIGTLFVPAAHKRSSRARWIGSVRPVGTILVNENCVKALVQRHGSLLAVGVVDVRGTFKRGDVVDVVGPASQIVARGLSNYNAADVSRIQGKKTAEVRSLLKEEAYDEVIHRDNLVVLTA
ncbi:MAG: glutamate 5-kinase [Phycisphaerales bacterium]|nr:glutamate 5-kinase [Phycisphaerales bacterium]